MSGQEGEVNEEEVNSAMIGCAKTSLPRVYKKELSLLINHRLDGFFSEKIWGNKQFVWESTDEIERQIKDDVFSSQAVGELISNLFSSVSKVFDIYENADDDVLLKRCDGKQVFGIVSGQFSKVAGVENKVFKKAIYKESFRRKESLAYKLVDEILSKFSYK